MARHLCRFPCVLGIALLVGLSPAATAADWPVPRGPSREPQPYRYDPQLWKQVPRDFLEDAPACVLYAGISHLVEADGTVETVTHEVTRFNGRKGIERLGEYQNISYDPSFQKLTLNEGRVHKANGKAVPLAPRDVQLRDVHTDYQVYDHDKQLVLSFPNLEVGDVIEVKWTVRGKNPEYGGQFFTRYTFGDDRHPVVRDELRVRLPRDRELKHASVGGRLEPCVCEDDQHRLYSWAVSNRRQLPQDENLPSREDLRLQVSCSTFASWDEVGRWKQKARADCWQCTDDIRKVVEEVTRGLKTPAEKARALTYWVRRHVRYVSVGVRHAYTPHAPATVLANRYGDCKDQGQLLAVMLREAGVPVALASLGTLDDGQVLEEVPSPWSTHAILLVTLDGKDHWIDTTASLAGWDYLPRGDRDRLCYVTPAPTKEEGQSLLYLKRTPALTPELNRIEQTTEMWIGADGSSRSTRTVIYHGSAALVQRENWVEVPAGERRRLVTSELQDANSKTRLARLTVDESKLKDFDQPVTARLVYEIPGHFSGEPDREGSLTDSKVWGKLLSYNLDHDRKVALDLWSPFESRHRYVLHLPPAYRFDGRPRDQTVSSKWGSFRRTVKADPSDSRTLELEFHTRLDKVRVEPADFDAFRRFHEQVGRHYRVWLTLAPAQDLDEVPSLEALLALAPDDSASAAVLARLYLKKERFTDARRVLERARYYRPGEAVLWELTVQATDSLEEEEAAYRELVRRFPGESKYAVSLGATLVNRGDHAKAREVLEPILRDGSPPRRGQAHYQLARSCLRQGQPEKALEHLEAAGKADPDSVATVAALLFEGQVYEKLGRSKEAAQSYRRVLRKDDTSAEALTALIRLAQRANDRPQALDYLRRYTVAAGSDVEGLVTAAEWYFRLECYDDAFDLANRAREQRFHATAQRILGLVYLRRGNHVQAVHHLDKADLSAPVLDGLIRGHLALGNLHEAERRAEQLTKIADPGEELTRLCVRVNALGQRWSALRKTVRIPERKQAAWGRALEYLVCAEHGHEIGSSVERVETLLSHSLANDIELGPAFALRAQLALERGWLTKALVDADRAVALGPAEVRGYLVRGRVRLERADHAALADLACAAELSQRKDAMVLHWLAAALAQAGQRDAARKVQREALKLKPEDKELLEQLRELEKAQQHPKRAP
jgi:tetratricopeptide (TPR) repeat protein